MSARTSNGTGTGVPGAGRLAGLPELAFAVTGARAARDAAVPTVSFRLSVGRAGGGRVRSISLATDVRIAVAERGYERADRLVMARLFGQPEQWATSMRPLTWARVTSVVPAFDDSTEMELHVPCSRDMDHAVTSYFHGVRDGGIPLDFLFSGTVFHDGPDGRLRTAQIPWSAEAAWHMPASLWQEVTGRYDGGTRWLAVSAGTYGRLTAHRDRHALTSWDETVENLLCRARPGSSETGPGTGEPEAAATAAPVADAATDPAAEAPVAHTAADSATDDRITAGGTAWTP